MRFRLVVFAVIAAFALAAGVPAWAQAPAAATPAPTPAPKPTPAPVAPPALGFYVGSFTNVTINGLLAVGLKESEVTNTSRPGINSETRLDDNTSRIIIASTSTIAKGWAVLFRVESRFQADVRPVDPAYNNNVVLGTQSIHNADITGWADGTTFGGIRSPYGTLTFGKWEIYYGDTLNAGYLPGINESPGESQRIWDVQGLQTFTILDQVSSLTKAGVGSTANFTMGITRSRNVLRFDSPKLSGFDFSLAWSPNPYGDELHYVAPGTPGYSRSYSNGGMLYGMARYNNGPLAVQASYVQVRIPGGTYTPAAAAGPQDFQSYRFGASYRLPFNLKIGMVYDHASYDNSAFASSASTVADIAAKRDAFIIPVAYMVGDHGFYASYGWTGNISGYDKTNASQFNVGYDYALTKRAFIGLWYTLLSNGDNARYQPFLSGYSLGPTINSVAGEGFKSLGINMNYWF
ncbi:MAG TPA: porin [Thermoanaerobaculia bacterium]|nr:porin [Thermoanaerobaculia bacterium]